MVGIMNNQVVPLIKNLKTNLSILYVVNIGEATFIYPLNINKTNILTASHLTQHTHTHTIQSMPQRMLGYISLPFSKAVWKIYSSGRDLTWLYTPRITPPPGWSTVHASTSVTSVNLHMSAFKECDNQCHDRWLVFPYLIMCNKEYASTVNRTVAMVTMKGNPLNGKTMVAWVGYG